MPHYIGTSTAATSNTIWTYWNSSSTTVATSNASNIWTYWACDYGTGGDSFVTNSWPLPAQAVVARPQQLAHTPADLRAKALLEASLSREQRKHFRKHGHFFVTAKGGQRYRIRRGRVGNVDLIDKSGRVAHRLCAHPAPNLPDFDTMLAQKLLLEYDDGEFVRLANVHPYHGGTAPVAPPLH